MRFAGNPNEHTMGKSPIFHCERNLLDNLVSLLIAMLFLLIQRVSIWLISRVRGSTVASNRHSEIRGAKLALVFGIKEVHTDRIKYTIYTWM